VAEDSKTPGAKEGWESQEFLGGEAGIDGIDEGAGAFDEEEGGDPLAGLESEEGDVELSEQEIWKEMKRMLHVKEQRGDDGTSEEGSSFYGVDYLNDGDSLGGGMLSCFCFHHPPPPPGREPVRGTVEVGSRDLLPEQWRMHQEVN